MARSVLSNPASGMLRSIVGRSWWIVAQKGPPARHIRHRVRRRSRHACRYERAVHDPSRHPLRRRPPRTRRAAGARLGRRDRRSGVDRVLVGSAGRLRPARGGVQRARPPLPGPVRGGRFRGGGVRPARRTCRRRVLPRRGRARRSGRLPDRRGVRDAGGRRRPAGDGGPRRRAVARRGRADHERRAGFRGCSTRVGRPSDGRDPRRGRGRAAVRPHRQLDAVRAARLVRDRDGGHRAHAVVRRVGGNRPDDRAPARCRTAAAAGDRARLLDHLGDLPGLGRRRGGHAGSAGG